MCTKNQLHIITQKIADEAKDRLGDKLEAVVLYGSYARGDFNDDSDIDIMIRVICTKDELENYRHILSDVASGLSLEYNVMVSVSVVDTETFHRYRRHLPYFENVEREGIKIA